MSEEKNSKKITDQAFDILLEHPLATGIGILFGGTYIMYKVQEHLVYRAVLKANIDAYSKLFK